MFSELRKSYHLGRYEKVKRMITKKGKLLDIGCGKPCNAMEDGAFLRFLGYGIGIDRRECSPGFDFRKADVLNMSFRNKTFDTVVAMEILEHLKNINQLKRALKNIRKVLKDDGIFIISTPNNSILWRVVWFFWKRTIGNMWKDSHKISLDRERWIELLSEYFEIIEIQEHWLIDMIIKMRGR